MGMGDWGVKAHHNRLLPKRNNDEDNDEDDDDEDDDEEELRMPNGGNVCVPCWAAAYFSFSFSSSYASHCSPLLCHAHLALKVGKGVGEGEKGAAIVQKVPIKHILCSALASASARKVLNKARRITCCVRVCECVCGCA